MVAVRLVSMIPVFFCQKNFSTYLFLKKCTKSSSKNKSHVAFVKLDFSPYDKKKKKTDQKTNAEFLLFKG